MEHDVNDELPRARFVRLKNGDDVVSEVIEMSDEEGLTIMLINPLKIVYIPGVSDRTFMQVAFIPWVFKRICSEQHFNISFEDVLMISDVSNDMNEHYWNNLESYAVTQDVEHLDNAKERFEDPTEEELNRLQEIVDTIAGKRTYH